MATVDEEGPAGGLPEAGSSPKAGPIRRRNDRLRPVTRSGANQPTSPRVGGRLR
ncbi:MAG: hypothetical protein QOF37_1823, partial [Thermoleophilaceae bacterium]|nr:hypothetical protein [Thermoleophilaceae bacterium]